MYVDDSVLTFKELATEQLKSISAEPAILISHPPRDHQPGLFDAEQDDAVESELLDELQEGWKNRLAAEFGSERVDDLIRSSDAIAEQYSEEANAVTGLAGVRQRERETEIALRTKSVRLLDSWSIVLPQRIVNEELGDYLEDINRRISEGQRGRVWLRVLAAMFWTGLNAFSLILEKVGKRQAS